MPLRNVLIIVLTIVFSLACYSVASKNRYANLFAEALDVVDTQSLKVIPREQLFNSAMDGMLKNLDEHSMYISGDMFERFDEDINQEFGGVGMYVETDPVADALIVLAPMPGTPSYEAGLHCGDQIIEIDGRSTSKTTRADAIKLLRGPIGQAVNVRVARDDEILDKSLTREMIAVDSVHGDFRNEDGSWNFTFKDHPRIGYIRLLRFGERTTDELELALSTINGSVGGIVIDLRNNSGGLLTCAIDVCDMFLDGGKEIVSTRGRGRRKIQEHFSTESKLVPSDVPIVILINRQSASASEIVAGCLQDHERATLVGERTWGKGTVQNVIPIRRAKSALKLTTASYWRPSGKHIDRYDEISIETKEWGVLPNEGLLLSITEDEALANFRHRNIRDIESLIPDDKLEQLRPLLFDVELQQETEASAQEPEEAGQDNADSEKANPLPSLNQPHVDRVIEKAIELLEPIADRIAA
jgi:carboxyl-terminal processing protease